MSNVITKKMPYVIACCNRIPPNVSVVIGWTDGVAVGVREIDESAPDEVRVRNWRRIGRIVDGCGWRYRQVQGRWG